MLQMLREHKNYSLVLYIKKTKRLLNGIDPSTNVLFYNTNLKRNLNFQLKLQSARIVFEVLKIVGYACELVYVCLTVIWLISAYMMFYI